MILYYHSNIEIAGIRTIRVTEYAVRMFSDNVMSGYKIAQKRPILKTQNFSQLSQARMPDVPKKLSHQETKPLSKIKSGKLPHIHLSPPHAPRGQHRVISQIY